MVSRIFVVWGLQGLKATSLSIENGRLPSFLVIEISPVVEVVVGVSTSTFSLKAKAPDDEDTPPGIEEDTASEQQEHGAKDRVVLGRT